MLSARWRLAIISLPVLFYMAIFLLPLFVTAQESLRTFVPGRVGATADAPFTWDNYRQIFEPAYLIYLWQTLRLSFLAAFGTVALSYPVAHHLARRQPDIVRKMAIAGLVLLLFLSGLAKIYALMIALGPIGFGRQLAFLVNTPMSSREMAELLVMLGLFSFAFPVSCLMLVASIQDINPRYLEAAMSLGANVTSAHLKVVLPLCLPGVLSAFLVVFTLGLSAFIIPMLLGRGKVTFVTTLIYNRFSNMGNFPSGAALSIAMLVISLVIVFLIGFVARRLASRAFAVEQGR
jgi:ABC-type spermidine/putrescine transport system permease subunit I